MLPHRFRQLRRIQFSTAFECMPDKPLPNIRNPRVTEWQISDNIGQWPGAYKVFACLDHLEFVRVVIALRCPLAVHSHPTDGTLVLSILQHLRAIRALDFEVMVAEPLEDVRQRLGPTPFRLLERRIEVRNPAGC